MIAGARSPDWTGFWYLILSLCCVILYHATNTRRSFRLECENNSQNLPRPTSNLSFKRKAHHTLKHIHTGIEQVSYMKLKLMMEISFQSPYTDSYSVARLDFIIVLKIGYLSERRCPSQQLCITPKLMFTFWLFLYLCLRLFMFRYTKGRDDALFQTLYE